jgi:hypothetical protein
MQDTPDGSGRQEQPKGRIRGEHTCQRVLSIFVDGYLHTGDAQMRRSFEHLSDEQLKHSVIPQVEEKALDELAPCHKGTFVSKGRSRMACGAEVAML